ncbi:MAG: amino acid permease [Bacteroidales bacterium]|nr:amino acid permease [Bacteroidales bacterium]
MKKNNLFRKKSIEEYYKENQLFTLKKDLKLFDLIAFGIAAIIGAGIFSTIGNAAYHGGPAISILFVFTAIACCFSALCYAQFASIAPISGSAYTYTYLTLGELFAWIIGWDLILEYSVGNIAVAISWSDYFSALLNSMNIHIPEYLTMDFYTAKKAFTEVVKNNFDLNGIDKHIISGYKAYIEAPQIMGIKIIADIPAFLIVVVITILIYIGITEAKRTNNILVILKLIILLIAIIIGAFYINPDNWKNFFPNGFEGIMKGTSGVFFAYIGFDAISTTAEECKNPQKQLPIAIILTLTITTVLYVVISLILTGMVSYTELAVGDPLAYVFAKFGLSQIVGIISVGAIISMTGVLLVFQLGQPRIWMVMSRDGLLPKKFGKIHKRFKTPYFATIVTGIFVAIPSLFTNLNEMADLTSIGTIFAFVIVCAGILVLENSKEKNYNFKFKIPYFNSRYIIPLLWLSLFVIVYLTNTSLHQLVEKMKITHHIFIILFLSLSVWAFIKKWSTIPFLGLITNLYLLSEMQLSNWLRFIIWLVIGLVIYFLYAKKHSKLNHSYV